jgi:glycerol-3-phosphate acyltransferase PlsY
MEIGIAILVLSIGYLLGGISFSRLVTRFKAPDIDLNNVTIQSADGDPVRLRHMGATTASINLGGKVGCLIGWLDILKVFLPTVAVRLILPEQPYFLLTAIGGMVGHIWPIYYGFQGGGGMSAMYGGFLATDWLGAIVCSILGLGIGFVIVHNILVAYLSGAWLMILWLAITTRSPLYVGYAVLVNLLFTAALIPEIKEQLKARKEGKSDMKMDMATFPMGRGMLKIMDKLKFK